MNTNRPKFDEAFCADLGRAVIQFARVENLLIAILLQARPPSQTTAQQFLTDRLTGTFGKRVGDLRRYLEALEDFADYEDDLGVLENGRKIRDFVVHGLWKRTDDGLYTCIMYNRDGESIENAVDGPALLQAAIETAEAFDRLHGRLVETQQVSKTIPCHLLDAVE